MNNKNQLGVEFFAVLALTLVVLLALIVSLFVITLGGKSDMPLDNDYDPAVKPDDTSSVNVGVNKSALFPTRPSKASYIIGKSNNVITLGSEIQSQNTILVDLDSMTSIAEKNADAKMYPASMTKVMTLLVACENVEDLDEVLTIKQEHIDYYNQSGGGSSFFEMKDLVGEQLTVKDALYLISFQSDTISCILMAEHIAGGEKAFVELMNQKAKAIGLTGTNFVNCTGLYNDNHYSTARDIASIMAYAIENEMAKEILFSTDAHAFESSKFYTAKDPTKKLTYYPSPEWYIKSSRFNGKVKLETSTVVAGKTGYVDESGCSLVSIAKSTSGKYYINVMVGQPKGSGLTEAVLTQEVKYVYNTYIK